MLQPLQCRLFECLYQTRLWSIWPLDPASLRSTTRDSSGSERCQMMKRTRAMFVVIVSLSEHLYQKANIPDAQRSPRSVPTTLHLHGPLPHSLPSPPLRVPDTHHFLEAQGSEAQTRSITVRRHHPIQETAQKEPFNLASVSQSQKCLDHGTVCITIPHASAQTDLPQHSYFTVNTTTLLSSVAILVLGIQRYPRSLASFGETKRSRRSRGGKDSQR